MTGREWLLATLLAVIVYPIALLALSGPRLFDRPFWSDETLSWLIASDPSFSHGMAALAGGVDTNAPILHWTYHLVGNAFGHTTLTYRLTSTLLMSAALLGIYATVRRSSGRLAASLGALAVMTLPIILAHTTEARFYSSFLAAAVWTSYLIDRRSDRATSLNGILIGIASVWLCGVHYFGILAMGCIAAYAVWFHRSLGWKRLIDLLWPMSAGVAMTACLWPLLMAQRSAVSGVGGTWVPDRFLQNVATSVHMLMPIGSALVLGAIVALALVATKQGKRRNLSLPATSMAGLLLMPIVLVAFDRLLQPVLVPRYLIPSLAGVAVLVAMCAGVMSIRMQRACVAAFGVMFVIGGITMRMKMANPMPNTGMGVLAQVPRDEVPIVVDWRGHFMAIWADRESQRDRIVYVDDRRITHPDLDQAIPFEREMVRITHGFYGFPRTIDVSDLRTLGTFRFVTEFPESAMERLGGMQVEQQSSMGYLVRAPERGDDATADMK